jgi:hypothetical protein
MGKKWLKDYSLKRKNRGRKKKNFKSRKDCSKVINKQNLPLVSQKVKKSAIIQTFQDKYRAKSIKTSYKERKCMRRAAKVETKASAKEK